VLDAARRGILPLEAAVAYVTSAPAKRFGLYPQKGTLAPGSDADIALVSLDTPFRPSPETLVTRAAGCAVVFSGMTLSARVESTIVNGVVAYARQAVTPERAGRFTAGTAMSSRSTMLERV
jgi:allantoinase